GNTVYKEEKLKKLLFTQPGMTFNRIFFRNDIQRLREKFQADGYVMTRVQDVQVEDGVVVVSIVEPRINDIIIQGNKRTKTYVIRRNIPLKDGDLFNSTLLRHSITKLRNLGFFEDVNVGFEPVEGRDDVDIILTVQEKRSASLVFSVSYGSSSGFGGGVSFRESNLNGRAQVFEAGFDVGDYKNYWISLSDPYMNRKTFSWKIGAYQREDDDLTYREDEGEGSRNDVFEYDEKRLGGYIGFGRKFGKSEMYSWYLTTDWHKSKISWTGPAGGLSREQSLAKFDEIVTKDSLNSKVFTTTLEISRSNVDKYLSYPKGDRETIGVEKAWEFLGGEWDYTKYWSEAVAYVPVKGLEDYIDLGQTEDRPIILAFRVRAGFSSGEIPLSERYSLGGANSLRGYESGYFKGHEMFLGNAELRIPVDENFSLVVFYDIGRAWNKDSASHSSFDLNDLEDSPGVGVRVKTPLGNIRLDVAKGDETQFHFGFGEMF
ncbi:MAG: BamA/OMP85 family outer membrane protein, partial [Pyramidobacter sp.]